MKKMVMLATVVMTACALNAAQYVWGFGAGDYEDINGNPNLSEASASYKLLQAVTPVKYITLTIFHSTQ